MSRLEKAREFRDKLNANIIATRKLILRQDQMTPEELIEMAGIYDSWNDIAIGGIIEELTYLRYNYDLYQVLAGKEHLKQLDWTPDVAQSMFVKVQPVGVIPIWVQPTGAHDAYSLGDKVIYKDEIWISVMDGTDNNTTVPDGDIPYNRYWIPVV